MRKLILLFLILLITGSVNASECTKYLGNTYDNSRKVVSRHEFINKYDQKIGNFDVAYIGYGDGYVKNSFCRRTKITYICLLDENKVPFWGYIIPKK